MTEMVCGKVQRDGGRGTVCCREGVFDRGWIEAEMGLERRGGDERERVVVTV